MFKTLLNLPVDDFEVFFCVQLEVIEVGEVKSGASQGLGVVMTAWAVIFRVVIGV